MTPIPPGGLKEDSRGLVKGEGSPLYIHNIGGGAQEEVRSGPNTAINARRGWVHHSLTAGARGPGRKKKKTPCLQFGGGCHMTKRGKPPVLARAGDHQDGFC